MDVIAEFRRFFGYRPETGELYWRESPHPRFKIGVTAGPVGRQGHIRVVLHGKSYSAHVVIWCMQTGAPVPSDRVIDHANCDGTDNRWGNLRLATISQNNANMRPRKRDLPKGVYTQRRKGRTVGYRAFIGRGVSGVAPRYLGLFDTVEEAAIAYRHAAEMQFGEFARFAA